MLEPLLSISQLESTDSSNKFLGVLKEENFTQKNLSSKIEVEAPLKEKSFIKKHFHIIYHIYEGGYHHDTYSLTDPNLINRPSINTDLLSKYRMSSRVLKLANTQWPLSLYPIEFIISNSHLFSTDVQLFLSHHQFSYPLIFQLPVQPNNLDVNPNPNFPHFEFGPDGSFLIPVPIPIPIQDAPLLNLVQNPLGYSHDPQLLELIQHPNLDTQGAINNYQQLVNQQALIEVQNQIELFQFEERRPTNINIRSRR